MIKKSYDEEFDILYIYEEPRKGKYDVSQEFGDFIIDFDKNGEVVGIEIMNFKKLKE